MSNQDVWIVRAEGVNFEATLTDTEDLSITRGASLALLRIGDFMEKLFDTISGIEVELLFSGASQCMHRIRSPTPLGDLDDRLNREAEALKAQLRTCRQSSADRTGKHPVFAEPFEHLCVMIDARRVKQKSDEKDLILKIGAELEAANRTRQMHSFTLPPPGRFELINRLDPFDRVRQAATSIKVPAGKVDGGPLIRPDEHDGTRSATLHVSWASAARRGFGRTQRRQFYADELNREISGAKGKSDAVFPIPNGVTVTDSISDIAGAPFPNSLTGEPLPVSLRDKVAVVYADGNAFGALRQKVGIERFSQELGALRQGFLHILLSWYAEGCRSPLYDGFQVDNDEADFAHALRLETLLWGGDEFCFAVPSWLALPLAQLFFDYAGSWEIGGEKLTHSMGVVCANAKTPIRLLRKCAKEIADLSKEADLRNVNSVTFEFFESVTPSDLSVAGIRRNLYGLKGSGDEAEEALKALNRKLALPGDLTKDLVDHINRLKHGNDATSGDGEQPGFPRSQLYGSLRKASNAGALISDAAMSACEAGLADYMAGYGKKFGFTTDTLRLPCIDGTERDLLLDTILVTQIWDYIGHGFETVQSSVRKG